MAYNIDTLDRFKRITKYDYTQLLTDFYNFNENQKQKIYDYYRGDSRPDGEAFSELERLRKEFKRAINIAHENRNSFVKFDSWELFAELEDIKEKLNTIDNSSKYLRSAIVKGNFNASPLIEVTLKPNHTLERLAEDLNSNDPLNDWGQIFLNNSLQEESYTPDGGNLLYVSFEGSDPLIINSVIDNVDSLEKTYGLDIQSKLEFADNDLKVLTYKETLIQTINILLNLKRRDNPFLPDLGIDQSIAVGSNVASVTFPVLFRQLYEVFSTDDSFKSIAITDAKVNSDRLELSFNVRTRAGDIESGTLKI